VGPVAVTGWILAGVAGAAVALLWVSWRGERQRRAALEAELTEQGDELAGAREQLARRTRDSDERRNELQELRRRLEKTRRRAHETHQASSERESRASELEERAAGREREAAAARLVLEQTRAALERERAQAEALRGQLAQAASAPDPQELTRLGERAARAEAELKRLKEELENVDRERSRYRMRERTHRRLYLVIKGELGAARDRLRALEGRTESLAPTSTPHDPDPEAVESSAQPSIQPPTEADPQPGD
jgi:DNA repair exonuclease SbcCD ATPase subunit